MKKPIKNEELLWIGLDFDGTLATASLPPLYEMGDINLGSKEAVEEIIKMGYKPTIYTARPDAEYNQIEDWHKEHNLDIRRIKTGKALVKYLIDDRAIEFDPTRPEESWKRALEIIRTGKYPW